MSQTLWICRPIFVFKQERVLYNSFIDKGDMALRMQWEAFRLRLKAKSHVRKSRKNLLRKRRNYGAPDFLFWCLPYGTGKFRKYAGGLRTVTKEYWEI